MARHLYEFKGTGIKFLKRFISASMIENSGSLC
jgi:hypothetical protein